MLRVSFNRTMLELKFMNWNWTIFRAHTFNRTMLELKYLLPLPNREGSVF